MPEYSSAKSKFTYGSSSRAITPERRVSKHFPVQHVYLCHADVHQLSAQIISVDNQTGISTAFTKPKPPYLPPRSLFEGTFTVVGPEPGPKKSKTAESEPVSIPSTSNKPTLGPFAPGAATYNQKDIKQEWNGTKRYGGKLEVKCVITYLYLEPGMSVSIL
jgi:hypothetical protein